MCGFFFFLSFFPWATSLRDQSVTEQQEMVEAAAKVYLAQKRLASCYASLILGVSLPQRHHMACGRSVLGILHSAIKVITNQKGR